MFDQRDRNRGRHGELQPFVAEQRRLDRGGGISCSDALANSTCTVDPATLNVTADGSTAFKVTVATNVSQSSRIGSSGRIMLSGLAALSLLILLPIGDEARWHLSCFCWASRPGSFWAAAAEAAVAAPARPPVVRR